MIDKKLFEEAYNKAVNKMTNENYYSKINNLKYYLSQKYPECNFESYYALFMLYKVEAEISFNQTMLKRYYRIRKYGYPKECPIKKYINQPTLF